MKKIYSSTASWHAIPLTRLFEQSEQIITWKNYLRSDGRVVFVQSVPQLGQRIYRLIKWDDNELHKQVAQQVAQIEDSIWTSTENPLTNWDMVDLQKIVEDAGWQASITVEPVVEQRRIAKAMINRWFEAGNPYYQALVAADLPETTLKKIQSLYRRQLENHVVTWTSQVAFVTLKS